MLLDAATDDAKQLSLVDSATNYLFRMSVGLFCSGEKNVMEKRIVYHIYISNTEEEPTCTMKEL